MSQRLATMLVLVIAVATAGAGIGAYAAVRALDDGPSRQELVADRGAAVMPFDLDKTTHVFRKTDTGGVQSVTVDDPSDADQVPLIRQHLQEEVSRFGRGDFSDPMAIHGAEMPGVAELASAGDRLTIEYRQLPDGASLVFSAGDSALIDAVHSWFDAQVSDHDRHATH